MVCCLNPDCDYPENSDSADCCQACGTPLINQLRNRYRPIRFLGQGGFGRTYLAEDSDRLNTRCVIKQFTHQPKSSKSFDKALQLFNQEAMRLNELGEHPQIPTLLAYFEHQGNLYLVQQVIEGHTLLEEVQKSGAFNEEKVRQILTDLLPVLQFIHDRNVVHRDINPTNILRRHIDGKLVLIDFGIAKQLATSLTGDTSGTRIGTEGYSPIEQLRSGEAYPSSDLYSLGATCLCVLTACKPEKLYSALEGRWLWQEKLEEAGRSVSPQLAEILSRLVKDLISERYSSAAATLDALSALPSLPQSVPGWTRQHTDGNGLISDKISGPLSTQSLFSQPAAVTETSVSPLPPTMPPYGSSQTGASNSLRSGSSNDATVIQPAARPSEPPRVARSSGERPSGNRTSGGRSSAERFSAGQGSFGRSTSGPSSAEPARWRLVKTFSGHRSWVSAVAFNPTMPMIASGGLDDIVRIWDRETGELTHSLSGHSHGINHLVFSPKGQVLASCSDDDTIRVWNLGTGKILHTLQGHRRDVTSVDIGSKGFLLVSGSEDCTIGVWKLDSGSLLKTLSGNNVGMIRCVALTADEQFVVSGGFDNKIRIWQLATGEVFKLLSGHINSIHDLAVSQDSRLIVSASKDKSVRLWSLRSGNLIHTLQGHTREVNSVALTPDQRTVVSAGGDSTLKVWDTKTGELIETLMEHSNSVTAVDIDASGEYMASASSDKTIKLWQRR